MNQRDADPTVLIGGDSLATAPSPDAVESNARLSEDEPDQEELLDYAPVPPRNSQMLLVRFRHGARLQPMHYSLDEENP